MVTKKDLVIVALATFCLTATLFLIIPTRSQNDRYDPWLDVNDDGTINILDISASAIAFGTSGVPINKTALLLDLQAQIESLNITVQGLQGKIGAMPAIATYVINTDGSNYWATRYDGKIVYNGTDAKMVIQSTLNVMSELQTIVILGDLTVNSEIAILKPINYYHFGRARIQGDFSYLRVGDGANLVEKWLFVYVTSIEGPYQPVPPQDRTIGRGIHLVNCAQSTFVIGRIGECWAGIFFSNEGGAQAILSDNKFYFNNIEGCNKAVFFEGAPSLAQSPFMEGNEFHGNIFGNNRGIEIEANTQAGWGMFMGVIDDAPVVGSKDFYNFGIQNFGWLIIAKFIRTSESRFNSNDKVITSS